MKKIKNLVFCSGLFLLMLPTVVSAASLYENPYLYEIENPPIEYNDSVAPKALVAEVLHSAKQDYRPQIGWGKLYGHTYKYMSFRNGLENLGYDEVSVEYALGRETHLYVWKYRAY